MAWRVPGVEYFRTDEFDYGLSGNAANGGGSEGKYSYKVGIKGTFDERYDVTLAYIGYGSQRKYADIAGVGKTVVGGTGDIGLSDRNWLSLSFSTAF